MSLGVIYLSGVTDEEEEEVRVTQNARRFPSLPYPYQLRHQLFLVSLPSILWSTFVRKGTAYSEVL